MRIHMTDQRLYEDVVILGTNGVREAVWRFATAVKKEALELFENIDYDYKPVCF